MIADTSDSRTPTAPAPRRHWAGLAALPLLAGLVLTGCTASPPSPAPTGKGSPGAGEMLATASAGPTVPAGQSPVDLGTTVDLGPVTLRVHGVARGVAGENKVSTFGAQVQACVSEDAGAPVAFTLGSWRLVEANDESRAAVSDSWETPGDPEAPLQGQLVEPGSCVSSWVVFDESAQLKPEAVGYQNVNGDRIDWRVP